MDILWKGIVGGLVTAAIVFLSKRGNTLPGILPLFPTFAVIALFVIGAKVTPPGSGRPASRAPRRSRPISPFWASAT